MQRSLSGADSSGNKDMMMQSMSWEEQDASSLGRVGYVVGFSEKWCWKGTVGTCLEGPEYQNKELVLN